MLRRGLLVAAIAAGCAPPSSGGPAREEAPQAAIAIAIAPPIAPAPPAPAPAPDRPIRVIVGGDLIPHRPSLVEPASIRDALAPLAPLFARADAVVANYEAATGDVDDRSFRMAYAARPAWLAELPGAGVRAVTVANNHACDLGGSGLQATLGAAAASEIVAIGADADDPWRPRVLVERDGKRVCAVAWTTLSNAEGACARSRHLAVAPLSRAGRTRVERAIARARAECDATVAIFHGGEEYAPQTALVMAQARRAADAGADAVVVHHPHVASPLVVHEARDGRRVPIFASVGNLASNQGESWKPPMFPVLRENRRLVCVNGWTRLGVLADLSFTFDPERVRVDWREHLVWIDNEHADNREVAVPKIRARLLDPDADRAIVSRLSEDPAGPVALFDDPCWVERPRSDTDEPPSGERCSAVVPVREPLACGHGRCTPTAHDPSPSAQDLPRSSRRRGPRRVHEERPRRRGEGSAERSAVRRASRR